MHGPAMTLSRYSQNTHLATASGLTQNVAAKALKQSGGLWRFDKLRQLKLLNNIVEQGHRRIKRLVRPGLRFKTFVTASRTVAGYEVMAMIRKDEIVSAPANDTKAQRDFIAALFSTAA
ncbi:MAG TPA: DDE-type integrase/transposase/recombinase [Microvirga sp.]|nr:DDE-type integrase/transposase/recombinase [Microvirga sp.]